MFAPSALKAKAGARPRLLPLPPFASFFSALSGLCFPAFDRIQRLFLLKWEGRALVGVALGLIIVRMTFEG